jgi:colicin import membrane protein
METAVVVNPQEYGIDPKQVKDLVGNLPQIKSEREVLEKQYDEVVKLDIEDKETSKKARELRLLIKNNRTQGINQWHKTTKDYFLKGGQFVDAIKRMEVQVNERMEETLEQIEKHFEIQETKRKEELKQKRIKQLEKYSEFVPFGIDLGALDEEQYKKVFNGSKLQYEAKIEQERKAEEQRLENERLDAMEKERRLEIAPYSQFIKETPDLRAMSNEDYGSLLIHLNKEKQKYEAEQEKIRKENERLRKEAEAKEKALEEERKKTEAKEQAKQKLRNERAEILRPYIQFIRDYNALIDKPEAEFQKEVEAIKKGAMEHYAYEAKVKAEEEAKIRKESQLIAEQALKAKAEAERIAKEKAEAKAKEEAKKAPIKNQLNTWVDSFEIPDTDIQHEKADDIKAKFASFKKWAKSEIEKL